jgi:hypothetical protein
MSKYQTFAYSSIYVFKCPSLSAERDFVDGVLNMGDLTRARVVAPATTRHRDRVICHVVSLCEDFANFCVKTMYYCVKTTYFYLFMSCCVKTICIVV